MKKIIALLATFALILAVAPMSLAASVNYVVDLGDAVTPMAMGPIVYPLNISISGMPNPAAGGMFTLKYDTSKVSPAYNVNGAMTGALDSATLASWKANAIIYSGISEATNGFYENFANGYYAIDWYAGGGVANDTTIITVYFSLVGETTTADFDADTFTVLSATEETTLGTTKPTVVNNGSNFISDGSTVSNSKAGTCGVVFNTYTKTTTSWKDTVTEEAPDTIGTESIKFPVATKADKNDTSVDTGAAGDVKRQTVMFAKNTTGAALAAESYGIKINDFFYPGIAEVPADSYWSIILLTTEEDRGLLNPTYAAKAIINYGTNAEEEQSITLNVK